MKVGQHVCPLGHPCQVSNWVSIGRTLDRLLFPDYPSSARIWCREREGRVEGEENGRVERGRGKGGSRERMRGERGEWRD